MEKSIILKRKDFYTNLADLVSNSGLPAFVMADILRDALERVVEAAARQEEVEMERFREANKKEDEDGDSKA